MKTEAPKYSMSMKYNNIQGNNIPGPGAYNTNISTVVEIPSMKMGMSKKLQLNKEVINIPGPGTYDSKEVTKKSVPNYVFGKS